MERETKEKLLAGKPEVEEMQFKDKLWIETKKMWIVAGPAIFTRFSTFGINVIGQAFIGHIGSTELAAYSLVFTVLLRFANGILLGMASALETLCGQSYGATASTILPYWIPNMGQLAFVTCGGCGETWKGFLFLAFKDLFPVIRLSLSSGAMVCLELWYNTVLVLLTGNMKNAEVCIDALAICLNINGWEMMTSLGFLAAVSVRLLNELGRGSSKAAKFSIVMTVLTSFVIGFILFLLFLFLRGKLAYIFTGNPKVADVVADLSPLLAFSLLMNGIQQLLSGVAVGAGWQTIVAYVNIACYYLIGIPVGVVLGYVLNMQVKGVWVGMLFGTLTQTTVLIIVTCKTDWEKQVSLARNRINKWYVADSENTQPQDV
ncbi:hypothetical protein GH714_004564 [Hevea brasiliensis]|uniref:Protein DETOXIFICATION n=1 Tax=Hevea brasiliensis TaxID=3981 RepID=A0A6A6KII7_HEVBR|nr:hypothetical protein GH714_004564 [Hevea brasiliensis]